MARPANSKPVKTVSSSDDGMTDAEVTELIERYSLSVPIRIPFHMLKTDWAYRFINRANQSVYQRRRGLGWVPVKTAELADLVIPPYTPDDLHIGTHTDAEGNVACGVDLVFSRMPRRIYDAILARYAQINRDKQGASKRKFHQTGQLLGVETFERES